VWVLIKHKGWFCARLGWVEVMLRKGVRVWGFPLENSVVLRWWNVWEPEGGKILVLRHMVCFLPKVASECSDGAAGCLGGQVIETGIFRLSMHPNWHTYNRLMRSQSGPKLFQCHAADSSIS
jgi:hypothetical protein